VFTLSLFERKVRDVQIMKYLQVDDIVLRILGPHFNPESVDAALSEITSAPDGESHKPTTSTGKGRKEKWLPPSPIEPSWVVETRGKHIVSLSFSFFFFMCAHPLTLFFLLLLCCIYFYFKSGNTYFEVRIAVSHEGFTGSFPQSLRRLANLESLEVPALRPWFDPEAAHELIPKHLRCLFFVLFCFVLFYFFFN
jgi:hypothetical protein